MSTVHAQRAHQLDALRLDADAEGVLAGQASTALQALGIGVGGVIRDPPPYAIRAALRAIILGATLLRRVGGTSGGGATPGMRYLNLRYASMPVWRLCVLYLATVLAPVLRARASPRLRAVLHIAAFAHTLRFIGSGGRSGSSGDSGGAARGWAESLADTHLTYGPGGAAAVPLELLNRQHVWRGLAAGALVFAPILRAFPLPRRVLARARSRVRAGNSDTLSVSDTNNESCPACGEQHNDIRMPHRALPCNCTFCYICIALARDSNTYRCPRCAIPVHDIVRAQPKSLVN